jgi:hypothetical protein
VENNDERYAMMSGDKGTCHKHRKVKNVHHKDKIEQLRKKKCQKHDSRQLFPSECAKMITGGTQEVSQKVVPDERLCPPDHVPLLLAGVSTKKWLARPPLARASTPNPTIPSTAAATQKHL